MDIKIIFGILVILYGHITALADVQKLQLEKKQYLSPFKNNVNNKQDDDDSVGYKYSLPEAINDPLPQKVNYMESLKLDFPNKDIIVKPIFKGALISGLFLPNDDVQPATTKNKFKENNIMKTNQTFKNLRLPLNSTTIEIPKQLYQLENSDKIQKYKILSALNTKVDYSKISNNNEQKLENSFKTSKHFKTSHKDIVPINYLEDITTEYRLFNYDDEINLPPTSHEVTYKPGDDITFVDDITIIDDYVHFHGPMKNKTRFNAKTENSITNIAAPSVNEDNSKISIDEKSKDNLNNYKRSGHGYVYDKPKIPFNF